MKTCIIFHRFAKFATPFKVSRYEAEKLVKTYPNDYYISALIVQEEIYDKEE